MHPAHQLLGVADVAGGRKMHRAFDRQAQTGFHFAGLLRGDLGKGDAEVAAQGKAGFGALGAGLGGPDRELAARDDQILGPGLGDQRVQPGVGVRQQVGQLPGDGAGAGGAAIGQERQNPARVAQGVDVGDRQRAVAADHQRRQAGQHRGVVDRQAGIGGQRAGVAGTGARAGWVGVGQQHPVAAHPCPERGGGSDDPGADHGDVDIRHGAGPFSVWQRPRAPAAGWSAHRRRGPRTARRC